MADTNAAPIYEPTQYARVTVRLEGGTRTFWGLELKGGRTGLRVFAVYAKDGERRNEVVVASRRDIVKEAPARVSLKYGEMEVVR